MISEREWERRWRATHLCRLLSELEQSFVGPLLFPFTPLLWRHLRAVLLERALDLPQALERQFREALPEKKKGGGEAFGYSDRHRSGRCALTSSAGPGHPP